MKEVLREKRGAIALMLVLGLGISACGNTDAARPDNPITKPVVKSGFSVHDKYFTNGTREIFVDGKDYEGLSGSNIFEFCDGPDLVEETLQDGGFRGNQSNALSRSVDYPGCADGKLTPSDFRIPPTTTTTAR